MISKTLLTIGIPTFNSCLYLKEAIDNILNQIRFLDYVELLVCDNASDDGTQILIEEYVENFPHIIKYIRHSSNLGMDKNFWSVIENANGEFVHLHADDDFYTENAVERIINIIINYALDAILLSNNYLNTLNGKIILNNESDVNDIVCEVAGDKFFLHENLKSLCLTNVVVKKSKCLEIINIEKYFGCQWLHVALLMEIVNPTSTAYIFNFKNPVVTVRIGNQKWLEKDGAITFYYKALLLFSKLKNFGYDDNIFETIKTKFYPLILNSDRINFNNIYLNIYYCFKFFKFYKNRPKKYILFCMRLVLRKHRPFFEGWEKIGN